jgi:hypothetical protein
VVDSGDGDVDGGEDEEWDRACRAELGRDDGDDVEGLPC